MRVGKSESCSGVEEAAQVVELDAVAVVDDEEADEEDEVVMVLVAGEEGGEIEGAGETEVVEAVAAGGEGDVLAVVVEEAAVEASLAGEIGGEVLDVVQASLAAETVEIDRGTVDPVGADTDTGVVTDGADVVAVTGVEAGAMLVPEVTAAVL
jgi:hypothetical protein